MLTESQNFRILDMLKTVYPTKTVFCGGYKNCVLQGYKNKHNFDFFLSQNTMDTIEVKPDHYTCNSVAESLMAENSY